MRSKPAETSVMEAREFYEIGSTCNTFSGVIASGGLRANAAHDGGEILSRRPQYEVSLLGPGIRGTESSSKRTEGLRSACGTRLLRSAGSEAGVQANCRFEA